MGANNKDRACESAVAFELLVVDSHRAEGLRLVQELDELREVEQASYATPAGVLLGASTLQGNALLYRVRSALGPGLGEREQLSILFAQRALMAVLIIHRDHKSLGDWVQQGFDQVCFVEQVDAGPSGLQLLPHFEAACAQFGAKRELRTRLEHNERELADKTLIKNATQLLMCEHQLTERTAYRRLQRHSMDTNLKMTDVARRVVAQSSANSMVVVSSGTKNG